MEEGSFREDLYYRINVFPIYIPPLRERKKDIDVLVDYFIQKYARKYDKIIKTKTDSFMNILHNYSFPGNVRELENIIERAIIIARQSVLDKDLLPELNYNNINTGAIELNIWENEKQLIIEALKKADGNKTEAAKILGISRKSLYNKIEEFQIKI